MYNTPGYPDRKVSPNFLIICAVFLMSAYPLWTMDRPSSVWAFLFVISGWIISLCLHEFGHAYTAFRFGDHSVAEKGYLTLNPLKYTNVFMSILLPVVFLMMGGIGFPGGAVYINMNAIRTAKEKSWISAAGPLATAAVAVLLIAPFFFGIVQTENHRIFWSAVSLLAFLQLSALFLNLLPVPGLDGFGIIEPFLKGDLRKKVHQLAGIAFLAIFFLLFNDTFVSRAFWKSIAYTAYFLGMDFDLIREGFQTFKFWNP